MANTNYEYLIQFSVDIHDRTLFLKQIITFCNGYKSEQNKLNKSEVYCNAKFKLFFYGIINTFSDKIFAGFV